MVSGSLTKVYVERGVAEGAPIVAAYPTRRASDSFQLGDSSRSLARGRRGRRSPEQRGEP